MVLDEISETLIRGESVKLRSFGLFAVRTKRERIGRNPRTRVEATVTSRRVLFFRPSHVLRSACIKGAAPTQDDSAP
jgi:integration host factor subunit alpha